MLSYGCQPLEHETNHANANHRLTMIQADFVVTAKPPGLGEPAEGSFYNPPLRKNFESFCMIAAAHDLQPEFPKGTKLLHPLHQRSQVATVAQMICKRPNIPTRTLIKLLAASRSCIEAGVIKIARINPRQSTAMWRL